MTTQTLTTSDNILGYTLKEKIGAGGYGEVWAAEAPGGIAKAVKIIFGCHDDNRAQNELKSLNKIKEVRHPFLLSLERIEVANGRLIIVTELADMSLNDRFLACREEGLPGIPRKEAVGYIRDAADALDYISSVHSLQHLDIKPENLLIVGGHIKVADFGLVKEVREATQSLMSGLTPAYAPPELFDGRPNRFSDQYSLAIVYAEMVGGDRPFDGWTAAKLAVQHMQSKPDLRKLSPRDQGIVLKALSKKPELRFANCREFVEELLSRQARTKTRKRRTSPNDRVSEECEAVVTPTGDSSGTLMLCTESLDDARRPAIIDFAGPLACKPESAGVRPTLFIGVGGTGTRIVRNLQTRICKQVGQNLPAMGFLCIDSDRRSLIESAEHSDRGGVNYNEILEMPLRKAKDYRDDAKTHLAWLSRRWIYNIPRSQQTEGLRPLGRLAFVDNSDALFTRISDIVSSITTTNAIATTGEATGLNPLREAPRIYVISSIAGGIGSGCIPDIGYAVRTALAEMGLPDDAITGILTHSTAAYDRDAQLAVANSYACLSELQHYATYGYPGDDSCGLPEYDSGDPAFQHAYFVNLGSMLDEDSYEKATRGVAEYLFHNAISRCQPFFDNARQVDESDADSFRTLGVSSTDFDFEGASSLSSMDLSMSVLEGWLSAERFDAQQFVDVIVDKLDLTAERLFRTVTERIVGERGVDFDDQLAELFVQAVAEKKGSANQDWQAAVEVLDEAIGRRTAAEDPPPKSLQGLLRALVEECSHQRSERLIHAVFNLVNVPNVRVGGARVAFDGTIGRLRETFDGVRVELTNIAEQQVQLRELLSTQQSESRKSEVFQLNLAKFAKLRVHQTVITSVKDIIGTLGAQLSATLPEMVNLKRDIETLQSGLRTRRGAAEKLHSEHADANRNHRETDEKSLRSIMEAKLREHLPQLTTRANEQLERNFFAQSNGLLGVLKDPSPSVRRRLLPEILSSSQAGVCHLMRTLDIDELLRQSGISKESLTRWIREQVTAALPTAAEICGGRTRLMVGVPVHAKCTGLVDFIKSATDHPPTAIAGTFGDLFFCYEGSNVSVVNIAHALLEERPDCANYVTRLHTRRDVEWSRLTDVLS